MLIKGLKEIVVNVKTRCIKIKRHLKSRANKDLNNLF